MYEIAGAWSTYCGERMVAYRDVVGRPDGKKPLGIPRRRWENNIKMNLPEVEWGGLEWIDLPCNTDRRRGM
jgi:hypothetical protein